MCRIPIWPSGCTRYCRTDGACSLQESKARAVSRVADGGKVSEPGKIERYDFDGFTWFSRRIAKGSRLRIVVEALNSPDSEKNYNSGGAVENETGRDARTAHITLYQDANTRACWKFDREIRKTPVTN